MTSRELFEAIGSIDDDLILAADKEPFHRRRNWWPVVYRAAPLAACLCLIAGAVLLQAQQGFPGAAAPETAMMDTAPDETSTTAAAAPSDAAIRNEEAADSSAGAMVGKLQSAEEYSTALNAVNASAFPAELADLLDTGSRVYRISTSPYFADRTSDQEWAPPETVPVYASMASARVIDTEGMYRRLKTMLQALGLDTALADDAAYTGLVQTEAEEQAAVLREQGGSEGDELRLWANAGRLALDVAPCEEWPQGLHITVDCEGTVCTEVPGSEEMVLSLPLSALETIDAVRSDMPEIAALAGKNPTGQEYMQTDCNWHIRFYDADDASTRGIEAGDLSSVEIELDEAGNLCKVIWRSPDLGEPVGEYAAITREEADELMARNMFLTDVGTLDGSAVLENLNSVHLVYTNNRTGAWYLPYWSYIVDEGQEETDPYLHIYREYLIPAISLENLTALTRTQ